MTFATPKLSDLVTQWTLVLRAVSSDPDSVAVAEVLPRYCESVNLYLRAVLQDPNEADDLCQEFAYRFARGDFRHVRPENGRFRDYVKVSILRLVQEHRRKVQRRACEELPRPELLAAESEAVDTDFDAAFRTVLIDRTWLELSRSAGSEKPSFYDVLRRKADTPERTSAALAAELAVEFGKPFTAANVRQMIHRAREQFSAILRDQVAQLQPSSNSRPVDEELADLGLLAYCLPAGR
jgi:RNA polymerase sigma-70 factor (ECF subfamily)